MFAARIERIDTRCRSPHVMTDLDAVVVVAQDLVNRSPKVVEEPDPVDPNQQEDDQSSQEAQRQLQTQHHSKLQPFPLSIKCGRVDSQSFRRRIEAGRFL